MANLTAVIVKYGNSDSKFLLKGLFISTLFAFLK